MRPTATVLPRVESPQPVAHRSMASSTASNIHAHIPLAYSHSRKPPLGIACAPGPTLARNITPIRRSNPAVWSCCHHECCPMTTHMTRSSESSVNAERNSPIAKRGSHTVRTRIDQVRSGPPGLRTHTHRLIPPSPLAPIVKRSQED